jgi:hypothetical protein
LLRRRDDPARAGCCHRCCRSVWLDGRQQRQGGTGP